MKLKVKIVTGFRKDQEFTIDAEEAHKAYYLFLNPEQRGIFNGGIALVGSDIRMIEPDYNATMGWNPSHKLEGEDWLQIKAKGVEGKLRDVLSQAKSVAQIGNPQELDKPLLLN